MYNGKKKKLNRDGLPSYVWEHFERSVPMSTYLVAFIVSDFEQMSSPQGNVKVWARKEAIQQADYSLRIGPQILNYFEDFFQIKFPLPKIDMVLYSCACYGCGKNNLSMFL